MDRVLALCDRLRADGVDAWLDQYEIAPPDGWPHWCARRVADADFVLVVCTEIYERRFNGAEAPGEGLGVRWEGYVALQELYDTGTLNAKYIPVLWSPAGREQIPLVLRGVARYDLSDDEAYWGLYRHLTGQPKTPAPPLGERVPMPPEERRTAQFFAAPEPSYEDDHTRRLGEELAAAQRRYKAYAIAGQNVDELGKKILNLRRDLRDGERLLPGNWLGKDRFQLLEVIGHGGFGTVWKAWDEERTALVAVKVLHGLYADDRTRRERFFRGARKMADLHHPGIVRVIEPELKESGKYFFVMEYVKDGDLHQAVLAGKLPQERVLPVILAVGEALAFAHERGIIHRDVKPANILLDRDLPKLTDFDLVRAVDTTGGTRTQGSLGTVWYSAPEILRDAKNAGVAADVFSLAMTTVFAFHGSAPPESASPTTGEDLLAEVWRRPEAGLKKLPCIPKLKAALRRGLSWEPEKRYSSVAELCKALQLAAAAPAADEKRKRKTPSGSRKRAPGDKP